MYYIQKTEFFVKDSNKNRKSYFKKLPIEHHRLRVHCRILKWRNEDQNDFSATHWEWKICNRSFETIDTISEAGPAELLNVIKCNCKFSTKIKTHCGATNCYCCKSGLPCITNYRNCHGNICPNVLKFEFMDDSEDGSFEKNIFQLFDI